MKKITAEQIAGAVNSNIISGSATVTAQNISIDSRKLEAGSLFVPIRGEKYDGHQFITEAVGKGASIILTSKDEEYHFEGVTVIKVDDTLTALHKLASWYKSLFDVDFVAVTGSTGKTTTKNMIAAVLEKKFSVLKTPGNYNNQIGLPLTMMKLEEGHQVAVVEMGMSAIGEIKGLMDIVHPRISVITNIGTSHIELLGSRENILKAKLEIFDGMEDNAVGIINADDDLLSKDAKDLIIPVVSYGIQKGDYRAANIKTAGEKGTVYTLKAEDQELKIIIPLPGRHNVYNSLAAIAVGRILGVGFEDIAEGLKNIKKEKMRLNIYTTAGGIKIIDDAYNASPDSMKAALEVLDEIALGRKIAVLGDMLEMGSFAEEGHRLVGEYVAQNKVDILITTGDNSVYIGYGAKEMGMDTEHIYHLTSKEKAGQLLDKLVEENDTVLFKGSRGMRMEELASRIRERS